MSKNLVTIYKDPQGGVSSNFGLGKHKLRGTAVSIDAASKVLLQPYTRVTFFDGDNFDGPLETITNDSGKPMLKPLEKQDKANSLHVEKIGSGFFSSLSTENLVFLGLAGFGAYLFLG